MDKKEQYKKYHLNNKEKRNQYSREYNLKNKEKLKQYSKEYRKTYQGKKIITIANWKQRGIIFHDYDLLYDIYLQTTHCDQCKCLLNQCDKSRKCLDHDHSITHNENIRNILCNSCNVKRK